MTYTKILEVLPSVKAGILQYN